MIYKSLRYFLQSFKLIGIWFRRTSEKIDFKDGSHVIHLGFPIGTILAKFGLHVIWCFLQSFEFIGLLVQKKRKIRFQDSCHLGLWIRMILAIFDLKVTLILSTEFWVNWPFGSGEEAKNRFSRWRPWWPSLISDRNNFSYFWSTSNLMLSHLTFRSEQEAKNRVSRWQPRRPSRVSDRNNFSFFLSTSHPDASYHVSNQLALRFRKRSKK